MLRVIVKDKSDGNQRSFKWAGRCKSASFSFPSVLLGRAACELQQMEVLLAEVLFGGSITHLPPADIAAILSCFVCESGMGGGVGNNANVLQPPQAAPTGNPLAARVALVSGEELVAQPAKDPLDEATLPTVPDHLQDIVKSMLKKANQVYTFVCVCIYHKPDGE